MIIAKFLIRESSISKNIGEETPNIITHRRDDNNRSNNKKK